MRLRTCFLAWLLPACGTVLAQAAPDCPPAAPVAPELRAAESHPQARDRGFLWRLQKDGRTAWLYGTVHLARPEWMVPGPRVRSALAASDVLALELDPADPEAAVALAAGADPFRKERVLDGLDGRIVRLADRACVPAAAVARLAPLMQLMMIGMLEARRDGLYAEFGVDGALLRLARALGKDFVALESVSGQVATLAPASEADERELLEQDLRDLESGEARRVLRRMMTAWAAADEAALASYPQWCRCLDTAAERRLMRRINDERNGPLADRIAALHAGGQQVFAAVGALHLIGPAGLPTLLRERGFAVQRVAFPATP